MARLRTNFVRGTITNNPLAIGDTTLTSSSLSSLPVVSSPDIVSLILDPAGSAPEIVHVTAHSSAATSATILRGQEGSSAKAHIQGTAFVAGPTATDFPANAFPSSVANGDILYGVAASDEYQALSMTNLGVLVGGTTAPAWNAPTTPKTYLRLNAAGTALEWVEVPTIIVADAFEWQSKIATHYVCRFGDSALLNNAVYGDLAYVGWNVSGAAIASFPASTGDFNAAGDPGEPYAEFTASGNTIGSPKVIGAVHLLNAIARLRGEASSRIRCIVQAQFAGTTDAADTSGVGVTYSVVAALGSGAGTGYWFTVGATNFEVYDGAVATDTGVVKDTNLHEFEIEIDVVAQTWRALIDGNVVKAAAALSTDRWPMSIAARMGASGSAFRVFSMEVIYA